MDSENSNQSKDKDFGFPFVEVTTLQSRKKILTDRNEVITHSTRKEIPKTVEIKKTESTYSRKPSYIDRDRKSRSPFLIPLLFIVVIVMAAMAYYLYPQREAANTSEVVSVDPVITQPSELQTNEENQTDVLTESIPLESHENANAIVSSSSTEMESKGQLHIINEKGANLTYHIIAGSLPNERLALAEAQIFLDLGTNAWIIYPYGDTRNYRLSVGRYTSFKSASESLESAKANFGESLWILKY